MLKARLSRWVGVALRPPAAGGPVTARVHPGHERARPSGHQGCPARAVRA